MPSNLVSQTITCNGFIKNIIIAYRVYNVRIQYVPVSQARLQG